MSNAARQEAARSLLAALEEKLQYALEHDQDIETRVQQGKGRDDLIFTITIGEKPPGALPCVTDANGEWFVEFNADAPGKKRLVNPKAIFAVVPTDSGCDILADGSRVHVCDDYDEVKDALMDSGVQSPRTIPLQECFLNDERSRLRGFAADHIMSHLPSTAAPPGGLICGDKVVCACGQRWRMGYKSDGTLRWIPLASAALVKSKYEVGADPASQEAGAESSHEWQEEWPKHTVNVEELADPQPTVVRTDGVTFKE